MNTIPVSFPVLGWEFNINPVAFGTVRWYGILIALGFLLAIVYATRNASRFGVPKDRVLDVAIWGMIGGMIGARTYYVIFEWENQFKNNFWGIFKIWEGGIAIYGGLIGGILAGFIVCKLCKMKFTAMLDIATIGFFIGQGIGRWGNFMNVEAFGAPMEGNYFWGMSSPKITNYLLQRGYEVADGVMVHPCFLYESLWCLLGVLVLHLFSRYRRFDGEVTLLYCVWYGCERFVVEGLRTDSLYWGNFRVSQVLSAALVIVAIAVWITVRVRIHKKGDPAYLMPVGKRPVPAEGVAEDFIEETPEETTQTNENTNEGDENNG